MVAVLTMPRSIDAWPRSIWARGLGRRPSSAASMPRWRGIAAQVPGTDAQPYVAPLRKIAASASARVRLRWLGLLVRQAPDEVLRAT